MGSEFCGRTRRETLWQTGAGFGAAALTGLLSDDGFFGKAVAADGAALAQPHFTPKAKSVIFLFMYGGPSHIDTFDYKPQMKGRDNQTVEVKTFGRGGRRNNGRIVEPRWEFAQHGQCGKWISTLFPHLATCADDLAFIHSMTADSPIHGSAMLMMNSGRVQSGHPCLGSWVNYGLGSVNRNLPGFVVMLDPTGGPISGAKNYVLDGSIANLILVTAKTSKGLSLFAVDGNASGLTKELLPTMDQTRKQSRIEFNNTPARLIGADGSAAAGIAKTLQRAATLLAAEQTGGAQRCLDNAVAYAKERVQFGRPIGSFQAIKHKAADMLLEVESAKSAAYYAAYCAQEDNDDLAIAASLAKSFCSEAFFHCAGENIQIHGGIGFTWEHHAHLYFKRAKSGELLLGDPTYHREILANLLGI